MAKGLQRSLSRGPKTTAPINRDVINVSHALDSVTVAAAKGFGSVVIGDFPQGNILFLGGVANLAFSGPVGSADLSDTWSGDFAIGTIPMSDATLAGSDVDIFPSAALGPATAEAVAKARFESTIGDLALFNNTDGSLEINLNFLVDAADQVDDKTVAITVTGEIYLSYVVLGDD